VIVSECDIICSAKGPMRFTNKRPKVLSQLSNQVSCQSFLSSLNDSDIGLIICDQRLRYHALNESAAKIHNVPVTDHLGQSFHQILGDFSEKITPLWERVFNTGQPLLNVEVSGNLPKRSDSCRLIENLFPLKDGGRQVMHVGCIVIETTSSLTHNSSLSMSTSEAKAATAVESSRLTTGKRRILSEREREVLRLLAEGKCNKEISSVLGISIRTVETYRTRIMLKLQAPSLAHLVHYAIRNNIVEL
jgi:DNA-binding CsgD family transcriptional regulator